MNRQKIKKIVLAYSGGLDTSAIIPWLQEQYHGSKVIAYVADIGQKRSDLINIKKKAMQSGALECYVIDLREQFISEYVYPVLHTGALYEGNYLLGTAMARPIIAKNQIDLALQIDAEALCHGATGKGNDQVRFETTYAALAPQLKVIAPWREWELRSREELINYLKVHNISTSVSLEKIYSRDENVWHISTEGGILENPWNAPNKDCWAWTIDPIEAPNDPEYVILSIEKGYVTSVNNEELSPFQCLHKLNILGAKHGIGRIDIVENRLIGMKSRGCYETPGGTIIMNALRAIEQLVLDRDSFKWRQQLGQEMSYVVYDGLWFTPLCESIKDAAKSLSKLITGKVVLQLYKGQVTVIQKKSINSLYSEKIVTFGQDEVYNHTHADGFIHLFSLSSRIRALKKQVK